MKNLNKSKSSKNYNSNTNVNHGRSLSAVNNSAMGQNQAFWEASIYAKFRKHLKKNNNKIIVSKQKYCVNPNSNRKTNHTTVAIPSNNDNNVTNNNMDFQNSKVTEPLIKNNLDNSSMNKTYFPSKMKI